MPAWLTALLPVVSALMGVVVANRASARRDAIDRLWQQRTDTYLDLINWTLRVENEVSDGDEGGGLHNLEPSDFVGLQIPDELLARTLAFASGPVRDAQRPCTWSLFALIRGESKDQGEWGFSDYYAEGTNLVAALERLRDVIRNELSDGTLRFPSAFRISQWTFSVKRHFKQPRALRRHRRRLRRN